MPIPNPRGGPRTRLAVAAIAIGLFLVGYYWGNQYPQSDSVPPEISAVLIRPPRPLPDFQLCDLAGQPFTPEHLAGHWTLLAFGRPNREPGRSAVERLTQIHNRLADDPDLQARLLLLLVARHQDSASDSGPWSQALKPLSGTDEAIQTLRAALGLPEQETDPTAAQRGGNPCYLIGPDGQLLALFSDTQAPASIAADITAQRSTHD